MRQLDGKRADASSSLETAALVLTAAMLDAQWPAADLGGALERMTRTVHAWRGRAACDDESAADRESIANELAICVQSLQYHDRLMQQLAAVRELLTQALLKESGAVSEAVNWEERLQRLREGGGGGHSAEGNVELF